MLTNKEVKNPNYYTKDQLQDDYYNKVDSNNKEGIGIWTGKAAENIGLNGKVDQVDFWRMLKGYNPKTNEKLSKYVRSDAVRLGQDLVFNANKDFSILYNAAEEGSKLKEDLDKLWKEANNIVRSEIESRISIKENGKCVPCSGAVIAFWEHETARQQGGKIDFHKHNHNVVANYAQDKNGNWKAVDMEKVFEDKTLIGSKGQEHIAKGLREMGFTIEEGKYGFKVKGIPEKARTYFSGRRNKIVEKVGAYSSREVRQIEANKKEAKGDYDLSELKAGWKEKLNDFGINKQSLELLRKIEPEIQKPVTKSDIIRKACQLAKSKHFTKHHVELAMAQKSQTQEFDKDKMRDEIFKNYNTAKIYDKSKNTTEQFYDKKFSGEKFHAQHEKVKKLNQSIDREKLKCGKTPTKKSIANEKDKLVSNKQQEVKSNKNNLSENTPNKTNANSKNPQSRAVNMHVGGDIMQQINALTAEVDNTRLELGKLSPENPNYMEKMAKIYALQEKIKQMMNKKAQVEYRELHEKQLESKKEVEIERTR
ncbi:relaxase domain-containing protein [Janthinobacterium sp. HSC-3S05]|uniref:MobF family relaxase n=1 Tax=Janthinobacterium lividum TaxID=29581 RepID=UPI001CD8A3F0|nr:MobF family relaxase [Janthinobacterium lividum]MCA1859923.1 relaxase domain-containing protein [Janthinobacterium lividum]